MKWFEDVFLFSMIEKVEKQIKEKSKYGNEIVISEKQANICRKYFTCKQCSSDYGCFYVLQYETKTHKFQLTEHGKYSFLSVSNKK